MQNKKSVLLIDDEPIILELGKEAFDSMGYATETVVCAEYALTLLAQKKFDMVVSDFNMNGLNGFEIVSRMRIDLKIETPVILLTVNLQLSSSEVDRLKIVKVFTKPVFFDEVAEYVDQYLSLK